MTFIFFFFFFQAEDGIRDGHVTGVQTCALPICGGVDAEVRQDGGDRERVGDERLAAVPPRATRSRRRRPRGFLASEPASALTATSKLRPARRRQTPGSFYRKEPGKSEARRLSSRWTTSASARMNAGWVLGSSTRWKAMPASSASSRAATSRS